MRARVSAQRWSGLALCCWLAVAFSHPTRAEPQGGDRYFVDFRSRPSSHIGHTYVVYFRADPSGRISEEHVAGLIPDEEGWKGLLAPIKGRVRAYKDDTRLPPDAIYRRRVTAEEFRRVSRVVQTFRGAERQWHAIFLNCNDFGIEVAEALNLRRPPSLLPPRMWVHLLKAMNERRD